MRYTYMRDLVLISLRRGIIYKIEPRIWKMCTLKCVDFNPELNSRPGHCQNTCDRPFF